MGVSELKIARLRKGVSQGDMGRQTGIHSTIISSIECRRFIPNGKQKAAILAFLGGSERDFFESSGLAK